MGSKKQVTVGDVKVGGGAPVTVQSMTTVKTSDIPETVAQIKRLESLGCDIIRVAVPDMQCAEAIAQIREQTHIPVVADVHFDHRLAIRAAECGASGLRINPGNIGGEDNVRAVAQIAAQKGIPIRIGVNGGSISPEILEKHGTVTPQAMYESATEHIQLLNKYDFDDICVSVKTSSAMLTIASYRLIAQQTDYPLHLGVTEAGTEYMGTIKSSVALGALLSDGIGDTIRVSLTAQPEREVEAGIAILRALGLRPGPDLISCPTCGRCGIDLIPIAREVERRLIESRRDITVAVMGCVVNGPGEASRADFGIAGGNGEGVLFAKGKVLKKVPMDKLIHELFLAIEGENTI